MRQRDGRPGPDGGLREAVGSKVKRVDTQARLVCDSAIDRAGPGAGAHVMGELCMCAW